MKRTLIAITVFLAWVQVCPAPIYETYRSIENIIERSDLVAVIQIRDQETDSSMGLFDRYDVQILHVLKGSEPKEKRIRMSLRFLDFGTKELDFRFQKKRYLVFLRKTDKPDVPFENLNIEGSHWELSRFTDLRKLKEMETRKAIAFLLKDAAKHKNEEAKLFQETIDLVVKDLETQQPDGEPTQEAAQSATP